MLPLRHWPNVRVALGDGEPWPAASHPNPTHPSVARSQIRNQTPLNPPLVRGEANAPNRRVWRRTPNPTPLSPPLVRGEAHAGHLTLRGEAHAGRLTQQHAPDPNPSWVYRRPHQTPLNPPLVRGEAHARRPTLWGEVHSGRLTLHRLALRQRRTARAGSPRLVSPMRLRPRNAVRSRLRLIRNQTPLSPPLVRGEAHTPNRRGWRRTPNPTPLNPPLARGEADAGHLILRGEATPLIANPSPPHRTPHLTPLSPPLARGEAHAPNRRGWRRLFRCFRISGRMSSRMRGFDGTVGPGRRARALRSRCGASFEVLRGGGRRCFCRLGSGSVGNLWPRRANTARHSRSPMTITTTGSSGI